MLTPKLKDTILHVLFGNPFVMDIEAEDMTAWIEAEFEPHKTTWEEFELIAWTSFDRLDWLDCGNTIWSIWVAIHNNPNEDWGFKDFPHDYPNTAKIKERFDKVRIIKGHKAA